MSGASQPQHGQITSLGSRLPGSSLLSSDRGGEHPALVGALGGPGRGAGRGLVHVIVRGHVAADAQALAHGNRPQLDYLPLVALQTHLRRNQVKPFISPGWEDKDTMPEQDPGSAHSACRAEAICDKGEC